MSSLSSSQPAEETPTKGIANPFDNDPVATSTQKQSFPGQQNQGNLQDSDSGTNAVLTLDRNATLTLGTDSLILLDEGLKHRREARNFCGLLPQFSKTTRAIPFRNVLWAELDDFDVNIKFVNAIGRKQKNCRVGYVHYSLTDKSRRGHAKKWVDRLLDRAYPAGVKKRKRIKVLINPFGGQGQAHKLWTREAEPIFAAAKCDVEVERTTYRGHAIEIARTLDVDAFDVVASASGDGLPHEVFNGLAKQDNPKKALREIAVAQIPCGSGNAMSLNLNGTDSPSWAALAIVKGISTPLDLMAVTQGDKKFYSFLSQAVGIIAESDLGTESLRWMGPFRFTWGVLVRIFGKTIYPAEISFATEIEDKQQIRQQHRQTVENHQAASDSLPAVSKLSEDDSQLPALRYGTVQDPVPTAFTTADHPNMGNFYSGNMPLMTLGALFFPTALPSDGLADALIIAGDSSRLTALRMLIAVEDGSLMDFPEVEYRKVTGYRIVPRRAPDVEAGNAGLKWRFTQWLGGAGNQKEGLIAIDGEKVPFEAFQAEVQKGLGTVLSRRGAIYEA